MIEGDTQLATPQPAMAPTSEPSDSVGEEERLVVKPFTRSMIRDFLKREDFRFLRDEDEDFLVIIKGDQSLGVQDIRIWFTAEGKRQDIYAIRAGLLAPPGRDFDSYCRICNEWNDRHRWPKAYVSIEDDTPILNLEQQIDLETGIHQELFDDFSRTFLGGISPFLKRLGEIASKEGGPPGEKSEEHKAEATPLS